MISDLPSFLALMVFYAFDLGRRQGLASGVLMLASHPAGGSHGDPAPRGAAAERGTGPEGGAGQAASNRLHHGQGRPAVLEQRGEGGPHGLGRSWMPWVWLVGSVVAGMIKAL